MTPNALSVNSLTPDFPLDPETGLVQGAQGPVFDPLYQCI